MFKYYFIRTLTAGGDNHDIRFRLFRDSVLKHRLGGTGPFRIYGQVSVSGRGKGTLLPGGNEVIGPDYL